jgi:glycosyltransferase involved in cell wall biosynthesis
MDVLSCGRSITGNGMKVCYIAGRDSDYQRNRVLIKAMQHLGVELRVLTSSAPNYFLRFPTVIGKWLIAPKRDTEMYFVGFVGHPLVPLLRLLGRRPIVFDAYISIFDTLCNDRKRFKPGSLAGKAALALDRAACGMADEVILDTHAHIKYFVESLGLEGNMFTRVLVGADDELYYPRDSRGKDEPSPIRVFYYCTFQPLHGMDVILDAMELLRGRDDIHFSIIGTGPEYRRLRPRLEHAMQGGSCDWIPWVEEKELPDHIARGDICLGGHFSASPKASKVIPCKVYQFMAMRKALIAGDNPANRELLRHERDALLVKTGDPHALADAISRLAGDEVLRFSLASQAHATYRERCTPAAIAGTLREVLEGIDVKGTA